MQTYSEQDRQLALHHAILIQQQKDVEKSVVDSIEVLAELPSAATKSSRQPAAEDIALLKTHLRLFQPTDFRNLVEERWADRKCGYPLCPNRRRQDEAKDKGKFRVLSQGRGQPAKIVTKKDFDKWCSSDCATRALYLEAQLSEIPAWERAANLESNFSIYGEQDTTSAKLRDTAQVGDLERGLHRLAIERQNSPRSLAGTGASVDIDIRERRPGKSLGLMDSQEGSSSIEGYRPQQNFFNLPIRPKIPSIRITSEDDDL